MRRKWRRFEIQPLEVLGELVGEEGNRRGIRTNGMMPSVVLERGGPMAMCHVVGLLKHERV